MNTKNKTILLGTIGMVIPAVTISAGIGLIIHNHINKTPKIITRKKIVETERSEHSRDYYIKGINDILNQIKPAFNKKAFRPSVLDINVNKDGITDKQLQDTLMFLELYKEHKFFQDKTVFNLEKVITNMFGKNKITIEIPASDDEVAKSISLKELLIKVIVYKYNVLDEKIKNLTMNLNEYGEVTENIYHIFQDIFNVVIPVNEALFKAEDNEKNNVSYNQSQIRKLWERYEKEQQEILSSDEASELFLNEIIKVYKKLIKEGDNYEFEQ